MKDAKGGTEANEASEVNDADLRALARGIRRRGKRLVLYYVQIKLI